MELPSFLTTPVIWFILGTILILLELALPGLIVIFFGIGAWVVALLTGIFDISLTWQIIIFMVASIAGLATLRRFLQNKFFQKTDSSADDVDDEFTGSFAIAETDLEPDKPGKISFKGTLWTAISDAKIDKGSRVKIVKKESITLIVTSA